MSAGPAPKYAVIKRRLEQLIRSASLPPGAHISEARLAKMLQVGRTPVRQALQALVEKNTLRPADGHGFIVSGEAGAQAGAFRLEDLEDEFRDLGSAQDEFADVEKEVVLLAATGHWRINLSAMAETYQAKRTTMESHLTQLEAVGLVARRDQTRWTIIHLDEARLDQIFFTRRWLEPNLLAEAVVNIPMDVLNEVTDSHKYCLNKYPDVDGDELDALEVQLHGELLQYSKNDIGLMALKAGKASLLFSKHIMASQDIPLGKEEPFIVEHLSILEAIRRRDSEECRLRLQAHLVKSRGKVRARLAQFRNAGRFAPPAYVKRFG